MTVLDYKVKNKKENYNPKLKASIEMQKTISSALSARAPQNPNQPMTQFVKQDGFGRSV